MKRIFTKISLLCLVVSSALTVGCLGDEVMGTEESNGSETTDSTIPGNSVIDARVFKALNLDLPELASVKAYYESDQYYLAAQALLNYFRSRSLVNGNVNLIAPSITTREQAWADYALPASGDAKDGYRFYVEGYLDGDKPYSYQNTSGKLDWKARSTGETEERFRLHRLEWMVPQGKAYRTSLDETYVTSWASVYESWLETFPLPEGDYDFNADPSGQPEAVREALYAWRPIDVSYRVEAQCDLLYYFMQSTSFTPQLLSSYLSNLVEQVGHVMNHYAEDGDELAQESYAVYRAGTIFPEMKNAAAWVESGSGSMNQGIDASVFEVLDLDYSGLSKVKRAYDSGDYYMALDELLSYYRSRTHGLNPNVDLANTAPTAAEQNWADYALKENGYRFYVKNFFEDADAQIPYSYLKDDGIDWTYWPIKANELRFQLHRHKWFLPLLRMYAYTGDAKYYRAWREQWTDWEKKNPFPARTEADRENIRFAWRALEISDRLNTLPGQLALAVHAPDFTADDLTWFLRQIRRHGDLVWERRAERGNHLLFEMTRLLTAAERCPELKASATWRANAIRTLKEELAKQVYPDGVQYELDLGYHISAMNLFRSAMDLAPEAFTQADRDKVGAMAAFAYDLFFPDGDHPFFSDTHDLSGRQRTLREATERIGELVGAVVRRSALYETEPWGFSSDHPFLNAAVCCLTHCSPRRVLELTQQVERELGRTRKSAGGHYADRTIDIDILLYDDLVIDEPDLKVPHPLMREREFVMKPLGEIMPCPQGGLRR